MSIKDSYNKKVTFDTQFRLADKIDGLTVMMGKLATRDNGTNRHIKPQICQCKRRRQSRNTCNYDRGNYQNRYTSNRKVEEFNLVDKVEVDQGMSKIISMIIGQEILGVT